LFCKLINAFYLINFVKNIIITFLLAIVLFQTCATVGIIVQFQANQDYYAEILCINKNRPELACEGKCVLMERLQQDFQQNQDAENKKLHHLIDNEISLYCDFFTVLKFSQIKYGNSSNRNRPFYTTQFVSQYHLLGVFHPPSYPI
jgi:hypothetical protein